MHEVYITNRRPSTRRFRQLLFILDVRIYSIYLNYLSYVGKTDRYTVSDMAAARRPELTTAHGYYFSVHVHLGGYRRYRLPASPVFLLTLN